jgi:hypothetical protein
MLPSYLQRERTRNAQSPSFEALSNASIVIVDGQRRNVSNLVVSRRQSAPEPSLYPAISDLPTLETTDQVFKRAQQRTSSTGCLEEKWVAAFSSLEEDVEKYREEDEKVQEDIDSFRHNDDSTLSCHDRQMVELSPGFFVPLCGAAETGEAVDRGEMHAVVCFGCKTRLLVIDKASMVICPDCDMIAPLLGREDVILGLGLREETFRQDVLGEEDDADSEEDPLANDLIATKDDDDDDYDQDWSFHLNFSRQRL